MTTELTNPNVFAHLFHKEQTAMTSSLDVAEYFGKRHDNVLQTIKNLDCSEEFRRLNFQPVKYRDQKGEMRKCYRLTRDGFTFLAME